MSESAQSDDSDSKKEEIEDMVDEANMEMDVDALFQHSSTSRWRTDFEEDGEMEELS